MRRWVWVVALGVLGVAAPRASAQAAPDLDIRIERDPRPGALSSALAVNLKVTVTEPDTGAIPPADFEVYTFADQTAGGRTEIFPCAQEHDNSPGVPRGVYVCTVLIDHGGRWRFHAVVDQLRADPEAPPVALGQAVNEFDIDTGEVAAGVDTKAVKGRAIEVALLWGHTGAAGLWLVATGLIGVLALPRLRRRLSPFGLHRLEDRFHLIVKCIWTATGLLVASGIYLLLTQTAYDTPFSSADMDAVFRLPYGKPYFLALAAKLTLYAGMVPAAAALLRAARRQLRAGGAAPPPAFEDASPWRVGPPAARGGVGTAVAAPIAVEARAGASEPEADTPTGVQVGAMVLVAGTVGLSLSITLLKYFHELIEAARALL